MHGILQKSTKVIYQNIVKPLLFRMPPDDVHHRLVKTTKLVQKLPIIGSLPRLWSYRSESLQQKILRIDFANPVGLSAGFDKNIEMIDTMERIGFGFMTGGSVTAETCIGNPRPWFYRLPHSKSLVVNAGLANEGVDKIARCLTNKKSSGLDKIPLFVSVAKTNNPQTVDDRTAIADYCYSLGILESKGLARAYEINISCPNTYGGEPFTTADKLDALLSAIDAMKLTRPIFLKMPINKAWPDFRELLEVAIRHNIHGVSIGNLCHDRAAVDIRDNLTDEVKGNLSGIPTQKASLELISETYKNYKDRLVIVGIGGVFTAEDAYAKIRAGASLVALITGMIFEGPQVVGSINEGLDRLLKQDDFTNISQAIGADHVKPV